MHFSRSRTNLFLEAPNPIPALPQWLQHLPEIVEQVRHLPVPVLDRASIERIFAVGPRRAQQLLGHLSKRAAEGGHGAALKVGAGLVLPRETALAVLEQLAADPQVPQTRAQAEELAATLAERHATLEARRLRIPTPKDIRRRRAASLPSSLRLAPGRLEVDFVDLEDLLSQLAELGFAIANDRDRIRSLAEGPAR